MPKKIIGPVVAGAVLVGAAGWASAAGAATTTSTKPPAATHAQIKSTHELGKWLKIHRRHIRKDVEAVTAQAIGITPDQLTSELRSGNSIAQVAQEHGVSAQTVENALTGAADTRINQAESDHKITQKEATRLESRVTSVADKLVNHVFGHKKGSTSTTAA